MMGANMSIFEAKQCNGIIASSNLNKIESNICDDKG